MDDVSLKPCPFCGESANFGRGGATRNGGRGYWFVYCPNCMASTDVILGEGNGYSKEWATAMWNRRAVEKAETGTETGQGAKADPDAGG